MSTLREKILTVCDRPLRRVEVPEWGCSIWLRPLSGADRFEVETWGVKGAEGLLHQPRWREKLVVKCCVEQDGRPVFELKDIEQLAEKNGNVLQKLIEEIMAYNKMGPGDSERMRADFPSGQASD